MALTKVDDRGLNTPIDLLDSEKIRLGTGNDLELFHDGNNSRIEDTGTGYLAIRSNNIRFENAAANEALLYITENGGVDLYYDNTKKLETTSGGVNIPSGNLSIPDSGGTGYGRLIVGSGSDIQIYHDGTNSYLKNTTNGNLFIQDDVGQNIYIRATPNENSAVFKPNGAVELFYDNSKKVETLSNGAEVSGHLHLGDNNELRLGNVGSGGDLKIYHNGSESHLKNSTGALVFASLDHKFSNAANDSEYARIDANGIKFNGDSAAANALDDYEEGTFSPALGGASNINTYNTSGSGHYTKIGNKVDVHMTWTDINMHNSSSGNIMIKSLPFTSSTHQYTTTTDHYMYNVGFNTGKIQSWYLNYSATTMEGIESEPDTAWGGWSVGNFTAANTYLRVHLSYLAA